LHYLTWHNQSKSNNVVITNDSWLKSLKNRYHESSGGSKSLKLGQHNPVCMPYNNKLNVMLYVMSFLQIFLSFLVN
jgi:hypothetical protein